ncbi:MAG: hypothetical protein H0W34_12470 [Pyrinomonadaceae bacterium]|nr:hypothetical protein [Pyrinomonadaceae bacterium]
MFIRFYIISLAVALFVLTALSGSLGALETAITCLPLLYVALDFREPA